MPTTAQFIKELHDKRLRVVGQMRGLVDTIEKYGDGKLSGEDERQWQQLDAEAVALGERVDELIAGEKASRAADEQRARFEKIVRPNGRDDGQPKRSVVRDAMHGEGPRVFEADFRNFSHKFEPDGRLTIESWDLSKLTNAAGLYTVPQDFLEELFRHLVENTGVRAAGARQITTNDGRSMPVPKTLTHGGAAAVAENATIPESDPTFGQAVLGAYKYGQLIQISNELATDTGIDLDGYLADSAGSNLGLASGADYVGGNGSTAPDGVAISPVVGKTGATGQTLTVKADDLIDVFHSIVTGYRQNASWLMRDGTVAFIRKIVTGISGDTTYVWQPGLVAGAPDTILGRPVFTDPNMPAMAANAYSILFGDWSRHYVIRDVVGVRFESSPDYAFANDQITFRALLRTDGKRVDLTACKAYRNSAT